MSKILLSVILFIIVTFGSSFILFNIPINTWYTAPTIITVLTLGMVLFTICIGLFSEGFDEL